MQCPPPGTQFISRHYGWVMAADQLQLLTAKTCIAGGGAGRGEVDGWWWGGGGGRESPWRDSPWGS